MRASIQRLVVLPLVIVSLMFAATPSIASHYLVRDGNRLHWERDGTAVAQVYFNDYTGSRWPVYASTNKWNEAARLGAYYSVPGSGGCPFHCVAVRADWYGTSEARGWAHIEWDSNGHFTGQTYVRLNNSYTANEDKDRSIVCQELGHAIGLDHQGVDSSSCMTDSTTRFPKYPNDHDWTALSNIYDH